MNLKVLFSCLWDRNSKIISFFSVLVLLLGCSNDGSVVNDKYLPGLNPKDYQPEVSLLTTTMINKNNQGSYSIIGACSGAIEKVYITINGQQELTSCNNGLWSFEKNLSSLSDGVINLTIKGVDIFSQEVEVLETLTKDTVSPSNITSLSITNPLVSFSNMKYINLQAQGVDGDKVSLYNDSLCFNKVEEKNIAGVIENFLNIEAQEGFNTFSVKTEDLAGNDSLCVVVSSGYTLDSTNPENPSGVIMSSPLNNSSSKDNTPQFVYNVSGEDGGTFKIYKDPTCSVEEGSSQITLGQAKVEDVALALDGTDKGVNNFYGKVIDQVGNQSACTNLSLSYTLEATGLASLDKIAMVGLNTSTDLIALDDGVEVFLNGVQEGGVLNAGDLLNFTANQGDSLSCTGPCYVVSEGNGTSPWASLAYAGKSFSSYVFRNGQYQPRIYVAIFEDNTSIDLKQNGVVIKTLTGDSGDVVLFEETLLNQSIQILSNNNILAYFVSRTNSSSPYDRDERVITPADEEVIGLSGYITSLEDNTDTNAYKNNGSNYNNNDLDLDEVLSTGGTSYGQYAVYATGDKPISITQTADGNGNNSTQSLPTYMLATNYGLSRDAAYVSFSALTSGTVDVIDPTGAVIATLNMTKSGSTSATPYLARYLLDPNHPSSPTSHPIVAGTRFICSVPCYAVYDDIHSGANDETLMMGFTP